MQTSASSADVLLFHCGYCDTELSVPLALQGVAGPCPCCSQQIQAPLLEPRAVFLPPLEDMEENVPSLPAEWGQSSGDRAGALPPSGLLSAPPRETSGDSLLPRQLTEHGSLGFRARLSIPAPDGATSSSLVTTAPDEHRRVAVTRMRDRPVAGFPETRVWKITRTALMVATGGLCAGLAMFLQDRNWVLSLPWRPAPAASVVEVPARDLPIRTKAMDPAEPFSVEDPSELEMVNVRPALPPVQPPRTVPVSASPIAAGRNQLPPVK